MGCDNGIHTRIRVNHVCHVGNLECYRVKTILKKFWHDFLYESDFSLNKVALKKNSSFRGLVFQEKVNFVLEGAFAMKRLLFVVLMMTCSVSWAEWRITDFTSDGRYAAYHDKSTKRKNGAIVKMWLMRDYSEVLTDAEGKKYQSVKTLFSYDCKSETTALISIIEYSGSMGSGKVVWSGTRKEHEFEWAPIVPGTISEQEWKIACGKK